MTRVCFIGNSHLAAVKLGWDAVKHEYPDVETVFVGAPKGQFADVEVENGFLVPKSRGARKSFHATSGSEESAPLAGFDVIALIGLDLALGSVLNTYARYRSDEQKNTNGKFEPVSAAYFNEIVKSRLARMPALIFREAIWKATEAHGTKVWLYPQPLPSITVLSDGLTPSPETQSARLSALKGVLEWQDEEALYAAFCAVCAGIAQGDHIVFEQPAETRISGIFTRGEFTRGSVRLTKNFNIAHPEDDYAHMNADYGVLVVRQILDRASRLPI